MWTFHIIAVQPSGSDFQIRGISFGAVDGHFFLLTLTSHNQANSLYPPSLPPLLPHVTLPLLSSDHETGKCMQMLTDEPLRIFPAHMLVHSVLKQNDYV